MAKPQSYYLVIATLMLTIVIDVMGMGLVFPILPSLFLGSHSIFLGAHASHMMHYALYGIGFAVWPLGAFFGTPYLGELSDRYGRKNIIIVCLVGTALTYFLSAISIHFASLGLFLISRLLSGFFAGSFVIAQAVVADVSPEEDKARNMGWITMAATFGFIFGPIITSFTSRSTSISWFTPATPFVIGGVISILNVSSIALLLKTTTQAFNDKVKVSLFAVISAFKFIFMDKRTRLLALVFTLQQLGFGFYLQSMPLVLTQAFGYNSHDAGLFYAAIGVDMTVFLLILQPFFLKRFTLTKLVSSGMLIAGVGVFALFFLRYLLAEWLIMIPVCMFELMAYACILAMFSNVVSDKEQGKVMGGTGAIWGLTWMLNALILGFLANVNIFLPILASGVLMLLSGLLILVKRS